VANVNPFTMEQAIQNMEFPHQSKPLTGKEREKLLAYGKQPAQRLGRRYGLVASPRYRIRGLGYDST
jgi:hypothetical protein